MSALFSPLTIKSVTLANRLGVAPMCQYMATDGLPNDWHRAHYGALGQGGAGLVTVEATGVAPEGRISPGCLGIWTDEQAALHAELVRLIQANGAVAGLQIAHAGRKASANRPWEGDDHIPSEDPRGWQTIAPSAIAYGGNLPKLPQAMTLDDIARVKADFVSAAIRARDAGYQWLELHFAHGYLGQSFLSPHTNHRDDIYGGSAENRRRFVLEVLAAVRAVWPDHLPLSARMGVVDFDGTDDQTMAESVDTARAMKSAGLDLLSVSVGFVTPATRAPWGTPGFLAPFARRVRDEAGILTASSWGFDDPAVAERAVAEGAMDQVLIGKAYLANPHWTAHAARKLGVAKPWGVLPAPYAHWLQRYTVA